MTTKILNFISFDKINKFMNGYFCVAPNALNNIIITYSIENSSFNFNCFLIFKLSI